MIHELVTIFDTPANIKLYFIFFIIITKHYTCFRLPLFGIFTKIFLRTTTRDKRSSYRALQWCWLFFF